MDNHSFKLTPTRHLIKDILGCSNEDSSEIDDQENCSNFLLEQPLNLCIVKAKDDSVHRNHDNRIPSLSDSSNSNDSMQFNLTNNLNIDCNDGTSKLFVKNRRRKKSRTTFTGRQIFELEKVFETKKYLSSNERTEMANLLNITESQIKIWFQNRRTKWKKQTETKIENNDQIEQKTKEISTKTEIDGEMTTFDEQTSDKETETAFIEIKNENLTVTNNSN